MKNSLAKYKIGLIVLAVFAVGTGVYVLMQASGAKQDNETYKKADKIAQKLNSYGINNRAPSSLSSIGITDVPDTIVYTKISSTEYKFCVTYKSDSSGFDPAAVQDQLMTGTSSSQYSSSSDYYGDSGYLYISTEHHKGENCQTVKLYSYNNNYSSPTLDDQYNSSSSSDSTATDNSLSN